MTCEHCGTDDQVKMRNRYHEPPIPLCPPCWLDFQDAWIKERQKP